MAKPQTSEPEQRTRSRLFWICLLVLIEAVVFSIAAVAGASDVIAAIVALAVGCVFVAVFNEKIWGEDWRERAKAERARRPR